MADSFFFQAKVASRGYNMYKETTWRNAMENEKVTVAIESNEGSKQIDPYCCAIQIKSGESVLTVCHMPREISRHCYFFLKEEEGRLMVMCLVQLIDLHPFHQTVWKSLWFNDFKFQSM